MLSTRRAQLAAVAMAGLVVGCSSTAPDTESGGHVSTSAAAEGAASDPSGAGAPDDQEIAAEVDRVVARSAPAAADATPREQAEAIVQCAEFSPDARYCLVFGWTERTEAELEVEFEAALGAEAGSPQGESTGDLSATDMVAQMAAQAPKKWADRVRSELEDAAKGIDKYLETQS